MDDDGAVGQLTVAGWFKQHTVKLIIGLAGTTYLSILVVPVIVRQDQTLISAWGFLFTVLGMPLAIAGFAVTIWQLAKTQRATEAASHAIIKLKKELNSFDVVFEVRTARRAINELRGALDNKNWIGVGQYLNAIRESLAKIDAGSLNLQISDREGLRDKRANVLNTCNSVEEERKNSFSGIIVESIISDSTELDDFLIALEYELKGKIGG